MQLPEKAAQGKETIARSIHQNSHDLKTTFLTVNCRALSEIRIEAGIWNYQHNQRLLLVANGGPGVVAPSCSMMFWRCHVINQEAVGSAVLGGRVETLEVQVRPCEVQHGDSVSEYRESTDERDFNEEALSTISVYCCIHLFRGLKGV
ncbi:sigma 54-interacting transcriptional regulator [Vibrio chagasii]|nr:sigma 54-interacting transcriptional regulator [Vibrio chagasii]